MFDVSTLTGACNHCVRQSRQRIPYFRDKPVSEIRDLLEQAVRCAHDLDLIFENHKQKGQFLAYASFHDQDFWLVIGPNQTNKTGEWVIITPLVHKDKNEFKEYKRRVNRVLSRSTRNNGSAFSARC